MRCALPFLVLAVLAAPAACGGSPPVQIFAPEDAGNGSGSGSGGSASGSGSGSVGGESDASLLGGGNLGEGGAACSQASQLVYVLSVENDLYSFDPPHKLFTKIGTLGCNAGSLTPNSMAVSRDATAWVNYVAGDNSTGSIFKVSTKDASCQPTNVSLQQGWTRLGMGFSSDAAGSTSETLYVAATGGVGLPPIPIPGFDAGALGGNQGLGKLSLTSQTLSPIGPFSGALSGQNAELTGTGDGRLYGFFTTTPIQVAQIDKTTGATSNVVPLSGVELPNYWAFSFWGGDFYLYTCPSDPARTTNVTHYSPSTGTTDTAYMTNIGFRIVGAGVSTCAPTTAPPK